MASNVVSATSFSSVFGAFTLIAQNGHMDVRDEWVLGAVEAAKLGRVDRALAELDADGVEAVCTETRDHWPEVDNVEQVDALLEAFWVKGFSWVAA
jgi:hypothetical protein